MSRGWIKASHHPLREVWGRKIQPRFSSGSRWHSHTTLLRPTVTLCEYMPLPWSLGERTGGLWGSALPGGVILLFSHAYLSYKPPSCRALAATPCLYYSYQILGFLSHIPYFQYTSVSLIIGLLCPQELPPHVTITRHSWTWQKKPLKWSHSDHGFQLRCWLTQASQSCTLFDSSAQLYTLINF